jgi:hypothetical protein
MCVCVHARYVAAASLPEHGGGQYKWVRQRESLLFPIFAATRARRSVGPVGISANNCRRRPARPPSEPYKRTHSTYKHHTGGPHLAVWRAQGGRRRVAYKASSSTKIGAVCQISSALKRRRHRDACDGSVSRPRQGYFRCGGTRWRPATRAQLEQCPGADCAPTPFLGRR